MRGRSGHGGDEEEGREDDELGHFSRGLAVVVFVLAEFVLASFLLKCPFFICNSKISFPYVKNDKNDTITTLIYRRNHIPRSQTAVEHLSRSQFTAGTRADHLPR